MAREIDILGHGSSIRIGNFLTLLSIDSALDIFHLSGSGDQLLVLSKADHE